VVQAATASGVDVAAHAHGALPGIVMPAEPTAGDTYRQEFWPGEAEDLGEILATDEQVTVAAGDFDGVVTTVTGTPWSQPRWKRRTTPRVSD